MAHDKIKDAARRRMVETGEPYTLARRRVIEEREQLSSVTVTVDGKPVAGEICEFPDSAGELLHAMIGGREPEPGSPYTHVHRFPEEPEEGEPYEPPPPSFTISRESE